MVYFIHASGMEFLCCEFSKMNREGGRGRERGFLRGKEIGNSQEFTVRGRVGNYMLYVIILHKKDSSCLRRKCIMCGRV